MDWLLPLSMAAALVVVAGGLIAAYRRRQADQFSKRSADLRALDERIATRVASLRASRAGSGAAPAASEAPDAAYEDTTGVPATLPAGVGISWAARLGLARDEEGGGRHTVVRDGLVVLGVSLLLLLVGAQLLPAAAPTQTPTATPTSTELAVLPTGTPTPLPPTPTVTVAPTATETPNPDVTAEPTAIPEPTPIPTACAFSSFALAPVYKSVSAGVWVTYSAAYRDTCGHSYSVTGSTTFAVADGTCSGSSCRSNESGLHAVTAEYAGHQAYALLNVTGPSVGATATPTAAPTAVPTPSPTELPTASPSANPTAIP